MAIKPMRPFEGGTQFRDRANGQIIETLPPQNTAKGYTAYRYSHNEGVQASLHDDIFDSKFEYLPRDGETYAMGHHRPPVGGGHGARSSLAEQLRATGGPQDAAPSLEEERAMVERANYRAQDQRGATPDQMEAEARGRGPVPRSPTEPGITVVPPHGANASGNNPVDRRATPGERMIQGAREAVEVARHGIHSPEGAAAGYNVTRIFSTAAELGSEFGAACDAMQKATKGDAIDPNEVKIYGGPMGFVLRRSPETGEMTMRFVRVKSEDI